MIAAPPATATATGMKPDRRRDCESETASEKCGKTSGQSSTPSTATVAPSTSAPHRRRRAKNASGTRTSPAIAIEPFRSMRAAWRL